MITVFRGSGRTDMVSVSRPIQSGDRISGVKVLEVGFNQDRDLHQQYRYVLPDRWWVALNTVSFRGPKNWFQGADESVCILVSVIALNRPRH